MRALHSLPALALAALLLVAGCAGGPTGPTTTDTPTMTTTETTAPTETTTAGTVSPGRVVEYESLNATERAAFDDARSGGAEFLSASSPSLPNDTYDGAVADVFELYDFVRYEGTLYEIDLGYGRAYASYTIDAGRADAPSDADVRAVADLPASVRDEVRSAVTNGSYHAPLGKWSSLPEPLGETEYVSYENRTYRLRYTVGDAWATELTVRERDSA